MKASRRFVLIGFGLLILLTTVWVLGAGFTRLAPQSLMITKRPVGYLNGQIQYKDAYHINGTNIAKWIWRWPKVPGTEVGRTEASINFKNVTVDHLMDLNLGRMMVVLNYLKEVRENSDDLQATALAPLLKLNLEMDKITKGYLEGLKENPSNLQDAPFDQLADLAEKIEVMIGSLKENPINLQDAPFDQLVAEMLDLRILYLEMGDAVFDYLGDIRENSVILQRPTFDQLVNLDLERMKVLAEYGYLTPATGDIRENSVILQRPTFDQLINLDLERMRILAEYGYLTTATGDIEVKMPLWLLGMETDSNDDNNVVVTLGLSGRVEVWEWLDFLKYNDPEYLNKQEREKNPNAPQLTTFEYFQIVRLNQYIQEAIYENFGVLNEDDMLSRFSAIKGLLLSRPELDAPLAIENFLKENYPWIWVVGINLYQDGLDAPYTLDLKAMYSYGDPQILYLKQIVNFIDFMEKLPIYFAQIDSREEVLLKIAAPSAAQEAQRFLPEIAVGDYKTQEELIAAIWQFAEERNLNEGAKLLLTELSLLKWQENQILLLQAEREQQYQDAVSFFREQVREGENGLNDLVWRLVIEMALEDPDDDPEEINKKLNIFFLRSPQFIEEVRKNFWKGGEFASFRVGDDATLTIEEAPLYLKDGVTIDPEFYFFYQYIQENP